MRTATLDRATRLGSTVSTVPVRLIVRAQAAQHDDDPEAGMTTAEYAMGTIAACGFSGILYKLLTSDTVLQLLTSVITKAFKLF